MKIVPDLQDAEKMRRYCKKYATIFSCFPLGRNFLLHPVQSSVRYGSAIPPAHTNDFDCIFHMTNNKKTSMIKTVIGLHGTDEAGIRYALLNPCAAQNLQRAEILCLLTFLSRGNEDFRDFENLEADFRSLLLTETDSGISPVNQRDDFLHKTAFSIRRK